MKIIFTKMCTQPLVEIKTLNEFKNRN